MSNPPKIMSVIEEIAKQSGYTVVELRGSGRRHHLCKVRQYAMWRAYRECGRSLPEVGLVFRKDHTTVLYGVNKVEAMDPLARGVFGPKPKYRDDGPKRIAKTYMGDPCVHGHDGRRYFSSDKCVQCVRNNTAAKSFMEKARRRLEQERRCYLVAAE